MTDTPSFSLDPSSTAIIFIEYQNEFTSEGGKLHPAVKDCMEKTNMLENSVNLASFARSVGATVIHCPLSFSSERDEIVDHSFGIFANARQPNLFVNGEWGSEFCPEMQPQSGDLVVKGKYGLCAFNSTDLETLLKEKETKTVVLAGFLANCCVESTMRTAYEKGYQVYSLKDCTAAMSIEAHAAAVGYNYGMFSVPATSEEIKQALTASE